MAVTELPPYTETRRDYVERRLSAAANKRQLLERFSQPWKIMAYWLMRENVCTIAIEDTSQNTGVEYAVPSDEVMEWFAHPLAHPDANIPKPYPDLTGQA